MDLLLGPLLAAAAGYFLYVRSRTYARNHPRGHAYGLERHQKTMIFGALAVTALALVLTINGLQSDNSSASASSDSTSDSLDGSFEDWMAALCAPGTFHNGTSWQGATGGGSCQTTTGQVVFIGEYESNFLRDNDLAAYRMTYFASSIDDIGQIVVFSVNTRSAQTLNPLTSFGFDIYPVTSR
ncbi:hypothetical protein [Rhodococcus sp. NCIMB 12038]|uniref:hypothetical protein n=1 Tax=Rhodococcus sp. NCIMB 12038 TaxID=933800 RepID=UPI00117A1EA6|nr:hypothetical protein [Rhodococcus sp. NCIMB 12038]